MEKQENNAFFSKFDPYQAMENIEEIHIEINIEYAPPTVPNKGTRMRKDDKKIPNCTSPTRIIFKYWFKLLKLVTLLVTITYGITLN
ncbi:MAG TPA: hypothetical protein VFV86_09830 [Nitrososphaeraceae archaeon]|nr:hypothetical protein [Nitrososphaeraceae archaeon]